MIKNIIVLARRDSLEAMRVAAGLTIFGHEVTFVFLSAEVTQTHLQSEQAHLLELADIKPVTLNSGLSEYCTLISPQELGNVLSSADVVLNI